MQKKIVAAQVRVKIGLFAVNLRSPDRREFLRLLTGATLASVLPRWLDAAEGPAQDLVRISILHTTDLHGHILPTIDYRGRADLGGMARCATQIQRWRSENPNSLLIDIGDVYQGTQFALSDQGGMMIDLFNLLRYDAWIVGNHEFDWGLEPFLQALARSQMPVLAANTLLQGRLPGEFGDPRHPFAKIQPYLLQEIAGIKIAIIGLTTPGMPFWFLPKFIDGLEFPHPFEPTRRAIRQARAGGADAIVLAGHMGLKERTGGDDFANRVMSLTAEFPEVPVFIAGHTHQGISSRLTNGVILTQADHFGIHVGKVDLIFDRATKKLLHQEAFIERMDHHFALDPVVLSRTQPMLDRAASVLDEPVGELAETLSTRSIDGQPSEVDALVAAATQEALTERGVRIDGVFHGLFDQHAFRKGPKTIGDIWTILPYENFLVTGEFTPLELKVVMQEVWQSRETRALSGFRFSVAGEGSSRRLTDLRRFDGFLLDPGRHYRIALNTFDASSAGHRFMKLRQILTRPEARLTFHPVQTREALIDYFRRRKVVRRVASTDFAESRVGSATRGLAPFY
ncbi:MAG: bifunctional metallophosphatase/5'-nucleotidase [Verrucomicrobiota bacterium]|nr:bifunctional metallophosphatase/5'-nucleotidase [Verrucomicrobiota bacterium]